MTRERAETIGWTFEIDADQGKAISPKGILIEVVSDDPEAALLRNIAEAEGEPTAIGYGLAPTEPAPAPPPPLAERLADELEKLDPKAATVEAVLAVLIAELRTH